MFFNEDGWPVITPYRYTGETAEAVTEDDVAGTYKYIDHGRDINTEMIQSQEIVLTSGGKITGAVEGTWSLQGEYDLLLTIEDKEYRGVLLKQWDEDGKKYVMTFSVLCAQNGVSLWGSGLGAIE